MQKKFFLYLSIVIGLVLLIWIFWSYGSAPFVEEEIDNISPTQQKQLEMYVEMVKLLITLSTFLLGAIGTMFTHFYEDKPTPRNQRHLAALAVVLSGASILCGYFSYQRALLMLEVSVFNLSQPRIAWASQLQFFFFLVSTLTATWFGYRATEENQNETPNPLHKPLDPSHERKLHKPAPEQ